MASYQLFGNVERLAVDTAASDLSTISDSRPVTLAVIGNVAFHAVVGVGTPSAALTDMYYPADQQHIFYLEAGQVLSVRGAASGFVWLQRAALTGDC